MKEAELRIGYFKQGDDMAHHLEKEKTPKEAVLAHAFCMREVSEHLSAVAEAIGESDVEITADTHMIMISADDELIDKLVGMGLVVIPDWAEDED